MMRCTGMTSTVAAWRIPFEWRNPDLARTVSYAEDHSDLAVTNAELVHRRYHKQIRCDELSRATHPSPEDDKSGEADGGGHADDDRRSVVPQQLLAPLDRLEVRQSARRKHRAVLAPCTKRPSPGADVAGVSPVPVQMWQG